MKTDEIKRQLSNKIVWVNYLLILVIFILNFSGSPFVKFAYAAYLIVTLGVIVIYDLPLSFQFIIPLAFFEGQGRIVWDYHPVFRIAFDSLIGMAIIKELIRTKNVKLTLLLPRITLILIFLHFFWYSVQIFNPNSLGMLGAIAATKIYIFPFFVFLMFRINKQVFEINHLQQYIVLFLTLLIGESLLSLYQAASLEPLLLSISPYYVKAMKGSVFIQEKFRPFGTAFLPGGISSYLYLSIAFLFLKRDFTKKYVAFMILVIVTILIVSFVCQVRSSSIKLVLILFSSSAAIFLTSHRKTLSLLKSAIGFSIMSFIIAFAVIDNIKEVDTINFDAGAERWEKIDSLERLRARRLTPLEAIKVASDRLSNFPIGIGPGSTGAASSLSKDKMVSDPIYDKGTFWGYDNLFLSLIIEFGYGAFFYITILLSMPVLLFHRYQRLKKENDNFASRIVLICFFQISLMLLGNWGMIGIPYNPESFFFWIWVAIGMNISDEKLTMMKSHVS